MPPARGPLSAALTCLLAEPPRQDSRLRDWGQVVGTNSASVLEDGDAQLALTLAYELHYRGWADVDERWEWEPELLTVVSRLEARMLADLQDLVTARFGTVTAQPAAVPAVLEQLIGTDLGPSLSSHLARNATQEQYAEFLMHRSVYHLKEADPHSFGIPRLGGTPKAALVEVQADEYGGGRPEWVHAALFADTMRRLGLDDSYGAYVDSVPAVTLAWANAMTLFGLHRRHRGMLVGHLAALEMTSSLPNRRYGDGLRRLGHDADVTRFFDEHVEADAVHEQIACHDLAAGLAQLEPHLANDIVFGAAAALVTDALVCDHLLSSWARGESSLLSG
jgi:Iron-containing redox enzyme